jgi:hypothetical protein
MPTESTEAANMDIVAARAAAGVIETFQTGATVRAASAEAKYAFAEDPLKELFLTKHHLLTEIRPASPQKKTTKNTSDGKRVEHIRTHEASLDAIRDYLETRTVRTELDVPAKTLKYVDDGK